VTVTIVELEGGVSPLTGLLHPFGFQIAICLAEMILSATVLRADVVIIGTPEKPEEQIRLIRQIRAVAYDGTIIGVVRARKEGASALDSGADDFVAVPVDANELAARIHAALRRHRVRWRTVWDGFELDRARRSASFRGKPLPLTPREYDLLSVLVKAAGTVVSRADLLAQVWGMEEDPGSNLVEVHLSRLRDKLGADARMVDTVRGAGYRLREG
jgi:two-component system, OmpR family, response regulator